MVSTSHENIFHPFVVFYTTPDISTTENVLIFAENDKVARSLFADAFRGAVVTSVVQSTRFKDALSKSPQDNMEGLFA